MNNNESFVKFDVDLARKLHKALTAGHDELFQIVLDPSPEVLRACLKNRNLAEDHLFALLKRRDLTEDIPKAIYDLDKTEGSHRIKVGLAKNPATPGPVLLALLPHLYLFELLDICILPGPSPDQKLAAERMIIQRLPIIELGNKLTLARRGTATLIGEILKEGELRIVETCLSNPRLKEVSVLQFLNGPKSSAETISSVAHHPRWKSRPNLRLAILKNRKTPAVWYTLFLPLLKPVDLKNLFHSSRLSLDKKKLISEEMKKRGIA